MISRHARRPRSPRRATASPRAPRPTFGGALALLALLVACGGAGVPDDGSGHAAPEAVGAGEAGGPVGAPSPPAPPSPCAVEPGTHLERTFEHEGEARVFSLFVPSTFACGAPVAVLVELHGAYGGPRPEQAYLPTEVFAEAERHGVVVARLRARPSRVDGRTWYYWDHPAGDLARNQRAAGALVEHLAGLLPVDRARVWASGYSSGGNLALSLLGAESSPFTGVAAVGAGLWAKVPLPARFDATAPRVYVATGYRDLHHASWRTTAATLRARGYDDGRLFERETDGGHAFHAWHVDELLGFFATGQRPRPRPARAAWEVLPSPGAATVLEVARAADGALLVGDAAGAVSRRAPSAPGFEVTARLGAPIVGLAAAPSGTALATDGAQVVSSADGGRTFFATPPLPVDPLVGGRWVDAVALGELDLIAAGASVHWGGGARSAWSAVPVGVEVHGVERLASGAALVVGRGSLVARVTEDGAGQASALPRALGDRFLYGVRALGPRVWVVGEGGAVLRSTDEGASFSAAATPTTDDLYAVAVDGPGRVAAVGAHGAAILSEDGGTTWRDVSLGEDVMLAGVAFDTEGAVVAVGERGLVRRLRR